MGVAFVALVGVIAGAVVTGGVQTALNLHARRLDARTAARLLYVTLIEADGAMSAAENLKEWNPASIDWDGFGVQWEEHREALAGALGTVEFIIVSTAFSRIAHLALIRSDWHPPWPEGFGEPDFAFVAKIIGEYKPLVRKADEITWAAAFTWREKRRGPPPSPLSHSPS